MAWDQVCPVQPHLPAFPILTPSLRALAATDTWLGGHWQTPVLLDHLLPLYALPSTCPVSPECSSLFLEQAGSEDSWDLLEQMCEPFMNTGLYWAPAVCVPLCSGLVGEVGRQIQNQEAGLGVVKVLGASVDGSWVPWWV